MLGILFKGGPVVLVLIALSILGVYIVVRKMMYHRLCLFQEADLVSLKHQISMEGVEASAIQLLQKGTISGTLIANVLRAAQVSKSQAETTIDVAMRTLEKKLDYQLPLLSSIITVAPILGLLGTVLGLMDVFNVISGGGLGDATQLSAGIAEALITTVLGLMISIPFIFAYQWLNSCTDTCLDEMEASLQQVSVLADQGAGHGKV